MDNSDLMIICILLNSIGAVICGIAIFGYYSSINAKNNMFYRQAVLLFVADCIDSLSSVVGYILMKVETF